MKPVFCGNFEFDARQSDLERLFRRYGKVDRVDMKSGFAFIYMEDERDAEDAIRALDRIEFGRKGRRLRVEWTKQERNSNTRRSEISRKPASNLRPSKTLFVINFDPYLTKERDLERHFDPYGKIVNVRIRRNFAFIQYENQDDATKALDATNMSKLLDRVITVEYAARDDDKRNGYSPDRTRDRSPRRGYDRGARSPSPYRRERGSPDYGHGRAARSPSPYRKEQRVSPVYPRRSNRSPSPRDRNLKYGRGRSPSPRDRNPKHGRDRSPSPRDRNPKHGRDRSPSPRDRNPKFGRDRSPSPMKERDSVLNHKHSPMPEREESNGHNIGYEPTSVKKMSPGPDYGHSPNSSPQLEEGEKVMSPDDYARDRSPAYSDADSPPPER